MIFFCKSFIQMLSECSRLANHFLFLYCYTYYIKIYQILYSHFSIFLMMYNFRFNKIKYFISFFKKFTFFSQNLENMFFNFFVVIVKKK